MPTDPNSSAIKSPSCSVAAPPKLNTIWTQDQELHHFHATNTNCPHQLRRKKTGKWKLEVRTRGRLQEFEDPYANHKGPWSSVFRFASFSSRYYEKQNSVGFSMWEFSTYYIVRVL